ncbi:MAG: fluoride efflux transporter CrcB [Bacteroidetes bacterium]|jgi:CrcB protein|nr:fluoride efflux transporter CrcB [Bacteroidota bacterium]
MIKNIFLVAIGGAGGSVVRYLSSFIFSSKKFPLTTFFVNILGCFFIGLLMGYFIKQQTTQSWQMLLVTGFCGGFTTFSAFSYDIVLLMQQQRYTTALLYVFSTLILGVLATILGMYIVKQVSI